MINNLDKKKVILGLSGGVDSTTAALILKKQGFQIYGLYFDINIKWDISDAKPQKAAKLAEQLDIPFIYKNLGESFNNTVISNFCSEYQKGRTPNPCILCNPTIKFKCLIEAADKIGAYYIATGHYAQAKFSEELNIKTIVKGANEKKDQSYMLYRLNDEQVKRLILPLGEIRDKEAVRIIARENKMINSEDKDSQEICFIKDDETYLDFLTKEGHISKKGNFVDKSGNILGEHQGIEKYTIGQRKGLGITFGKPMFVTHIDCKTHNITLGSHEDLFKKEITVESWSSAVKDIKNLTDLPLHGKIRYGAKASVCKISEINDDKLKILFEIPQRAATPGQSVVLYYGEFVVGGGIIC